MKIKISLVTTKEQLDQAFMIREQVFCIEQNVDRNIEMDEFDQSAKHILAIVDDKPIATARWRFTDEGAKMERFAVLKEYRGKGIGKKLVKFVLSKLKKQEYIYLYAQESVLKFYDKCGFETVGSRFYEADIPHKKMVYKL
jgi:predicted GNAT family N-acyltransferase